MVSDINDKLPCCYHSVLLYVGVLGGGGVEDTRMVIMALALSVIISAGINYDIYSEINYVSLSLSLSHCVCVCVCVCERRAFLRARARVVFCL